MSFYLTGKYWMAGGTTIGEAIFAGIEAANVKYEELSNGWWLTDSGVEGLLVSAIAESLGSEQSEGESLVMELPFRYILDWSGTSRRRGRPPTTLRGMNKADIVLLNRDEKPVCVIEVKRMWDRARCFADLARIRDLVLQCNRQHDGSLRRGFLALMLAKAATANETAKQRIGKQAEQIGDLIRGGFDSKGLTLRCFAGPVRDYPEKYRIMYDEGDWAHAGFCVELSSGNARAG